METLFPTERQTAIDFGECLTEKYRPKRIADFSGLETPKAVFSTLVAHPKPSAWLLCGPPGSGKTTMALALAGELRAELIHVSSAKLTVEEVERIWERVHYYPTSGGFWLVLCDEIDTGSRQAQNALLSKLDAAAALRPTFGGGSERGKPLPVIWIFSCNGGGTSGTQPPDSLEARFLSRCKRLAFTRADVRRELPEFLRSVWVEESKWGRDADFDAIAREARGDVREALNALELVLMTGPKAPELESVLVPLTPAAAPKQSREQNPFATLPIWDSRRTEWEAAHGA